MPSLNSFRPVFLAGVLLALCYCLTGCASISVKPGLAAQTQTLPLAVYAANFDFKGADIQVDRDGKDLEEFKTNLKKVMQVAITTDLSNRLIACRPLPHGHLKHLKYWVIQGSFTKVYQGSRLLRGTVGFGLGATKMECNVRVYDWSTKPPSLLLKFSTTGGSNAEPGAITAFATDPLTIVIEALVGSFGNIAHGITEDTRRTTREITAELSDFMYKNQLIDKSHWIKPKIKS
jgi:hypothetical protein